MHENTTHPITKGDAARECTLGAHLVDKLFACDVDGRDIVSILQSVAQSLGIWKPLTSGNERGGRGAVEVGGVPDIVADGEAEGGVLVG